MDKWCKAWYTDKVSLNFSPKGAFLMKKKLFFPALTLWGGAAAAILRLVQNRTGFEAETGLAVPGNPAGIALAGLIVVLAAAFFLLSRQLPKAEKETFPASFSTKESTFLMLPVIGSFLMILSGAADLFAGLGGDAIFAPNLHILLGVFAAASAVCLLGSASACRSGKWQTAADFNGTLLLPVVVLLVARLVLIYRVCSIDPTLAAYAMEMLALLFLTLGYFRLSAFAFGEGKTSSFAFYTALAVLFSLASLADYGTHITAISSLLLCAGGATALLGFLVLRLCAPEENNEA